MIPRNEFELSAGVPPGAQFWMPTEEEMLCADEGIGFFRGVWAIYEVDPEEAAAVVASEQVAIRAIDALASDEEEFDRLAQAIESLNPDGDPDPWHEADFALLATQCDLSTMSTEGLEVGVAGLAYALAAVGCIPAASCRGMHGRDSWADAPVVFAAIDRPHAEWLLPRVESAGCEFDIGLNRGNLLLIHAPSITEMTTLAASILQDAESDPPPPLQWGPGDPDDDAPTEPAEAVQHVDGQQSLFD